MFCANPQGPMTDTSSLKVVGIAPAGQRVVVSTGTASSKSLCCYLLRAARLDTWNVLAGHRLSVGQAACGGVRQHCQRQQPAPLLQLHVLRDVSSMPSLMITSCSYPAGHCHRAGWAACSGLHQHGERQQPAHLLHLHFVRC